MPSFGEKEQTNPVHDSTDVGVDAFEVFIMRCAMTGSYSGLAAEAVEQVKEMTPQPPEAYIVLGGAALIGGAVLVFTKGTDMAVKILDRRVNRNRGRQKS